jgi:hypothetical protein
VTAIPGGASQVLVPMSAYWWRSGFAWKWPLTTTFAHHAKNRSALRVDGKTLTVARNSFDFLLKRTERPGVSTLGTTTVS